ncbi:MAG: helix-turn-helix domain-containing protein [Bacilli bacterium]|nr:helix-turn-helix domain-containing protein [Bacilli bacterium]
MLLCRIAIHLLKDPFELDKAQAFKLREDVTYYQSSFYYYYGIINYRKTRIVVGPTRQLPISKQELRSIAFSLGIAASEADEFIMEMESLVSLPLMSLLQILIMVNFALTGEKKTLESVSLHESAQNLLKEEMGKVEASRTMDALEGYSHGPYNALDTENRLIDMIMRGDVSALRQFIQNIPTVRSGMVAQEQLRQSKNIFIVTATLSSRAAIRGGMDVTAALALSDSYIQRCELAKDIDTITDLNYLMVMDYAERVQKIRFGKNPSKLVIDVANYVQAHLSEAIKTSDIAHALYMGRSRLSTNFKKQTGINLTDYIMMHKIDEAKRLLRYSERSFVSIAGYLGFSSQSHFSKVFKKYTERTPFAYRQLHKHH